MCNVDLDDSDEAFEDNDFSNNFDPLVDTPWSSDDEDGDKDDQEDEVNLVELYVSDLLVEEKSENALNMLWNLVCGKNENSKAREQFAKSKDGADALVKAMRDHGLSEDLQWKCNSLIIGLSFRQTANKVALNEAGAPNAVCESMKRFKFQEKIQQSGCGAVRNLSSLKTHQQYVVEAGGIEAVVAAMSNFPEAARLQKCACDSLYNFANTVDFNRRLIIKKGGCVALAETQLLFESKTESLDREVYAAATDALKVLNTPPSSKNEKIKKPNGPVIKLR